MRADDLGASLGQGTPLLPTDGDEESFDHAIVDMRHGLLLLSTDLRLNRSMLARRVTWRVTTPSNPAASNRLRKIQRVCFDLIAADSRSSEAWQPAYRPGVSERIRLIAPHAESFTEFPPGAARPMTISCIRGWVFRHCAARDSRRITSSG